MVFREFKGFFDPPPLYLTDIGPCGYLLTGEGKNGMSGKRFQRKIHDKG
jgi:hypothetical protein